MKIVFMGTPDFAVPTLEALYQSRHEVAAVVTQPDKPKGRGKAMAMPPVKEKALEYGIPVYQPVRVRKDEAFFEELTKIQPDVIVVIAFGQILPERILNLPKYGCINIHASLLPKYRGAAPIQWAVINGDEVSGVTTMQMDVGLDTGDILDTVEVRLDPKETGGSLFDRLSLAGGKLILSTLEKAEAGLLRYSLTSYLLASDTLSQVAVRLLQLRSSTVSKSPSTADIVILTFHSLLSPDRFVTL